MYEWVILCMVGTEHKCGTATFFLRQNNANDI